MARKRQLAIVLKYLVLGLSLTLLIILFQEAAKSQVTQTSGQSQAQSLTQKGFAQLNQGHPEVAYQTWEKAYQIYRKLKNKEGMTGSRINQSLALRERGLYLRACLSLTEVLELEDWICKNQIQLPQSIDESQKYLEAAVHKQPLLKVRAIGLGSLGELLRLIGKPEASRVVLHKAIAMAKSLSFEQDSNFHNQLLRSLANTERYFYRQAKNEYQLTDEPIAKQEALSTAQSKFNSALQLYQTVEAEKQNESTLLAQLSQIGLLIDGEKWLPLDKEIKARRQPGQTHLNIDKVVSSNVYKTVHID